VDVGQQGPFHGGFLSDRIFVQLADRQLAAPCRPTQLTAVNPRRQEPVDNPAMNLRRKRVQGLIRQGLVYSLLLALGILGLGGLGFWLIDPRIQSFGDGLWLAFTTAATVGYGDVIPQTTASRLFSVLVVLLGLAVLSLVTASLSAIFVEKEVEAEDRQIEQDLLRELRVLREELHSLREEVRHLNAQSSRSP
jgi:voltage-gated potassium channel